MAERDSRLEEYGISHEDFLQAAQTFKTTHPELPHATTHFARRATRALSRIETGNIFSYSKNTKIKEKERASVSDALSSSRDELLVFFATMWGIHIGYLKTLGDSKIGAMVKELGVDVDQAGTICMQMQEPGDLEHLNTVFVGPAFRVGGMDLLTDDEKK